MARWEEHADAIIQSLATQIAYLNDLGIVYNNAFIDSVELGDGDDVQIVLCDDDVCVFDITNAVVDGIPCSREKGGLRGRCV